ncbi:hypothetical protein DOT_1688 [Desulfosporosinus sp. OT]|nr:hypothetical protein DOT_1688 [Desulfosporosinus sp. OT]
MTFILKSKTLVDDPFSEMVWSITFDNANDFFLKNRMG